MSDYEYAALISARAAQLTSRIDGIAPKIQPEKPQDYDPMYIAIKEVREQSANLIVRRHLPDGTFDDFHLRELILPRI